MPKIVDGDEYLLPNEASGILNVSHRTLQRWAEAKQVNIWVGTNGNLRRESKPIEIEYLQTTTRYRYYKKSSIEKLADELNVAR